MFDRALAASHLRVVRRFYAQAKDGEGKDIYTRRENDARRFEKF